MKILTVVGARPNFMKAAPLIAAINAHNQKFEEVLAGQPEQLRSRAGFHSARTLIGTRRWIGSARAWPER